MQDWSNIGDLTNWLLRYNRHMAHIHEKIDFTATVFIVHKDKVLLRKHEKYGFWLGVGGHIELDEDPNEAAVREVQEEVGLAVVLWDGNKKFKEDFAFKGGEHRELIPPIAMNRHSTTPGHEHIDLVYFARAASDTVIPENPTDTWRWCAAEELDELDLLTDVRFYARLALEIIKSP